MKGSRYSKSLDDTFSDGHSSASRTELECVLAFNAQEILAKKWRINSVADGQDSSTCISSSHSFRDPRENLHCQQACTRNKLQRRDSSLTCLEKDKLIEEIAILELEVAKLEQHLLQLYRQAFAERCALSMPYSCERLQSPISKSTGQVTQQESPRSRSLWTKAANINILRKKHTSYSGHLTPQQGSSKSKQSAP